VVVDGAGAVVVMMMRRMRARCDRVVGWLAWRLAAKVKVLVGWGALVYCI
jgi:hypothetical protein